MVPNIIVSNDSNSSLETTVKDGKEILYNGYYYDVTDFINRHPGGGVIKFYTERGEDATQAIQQFHFRSKDRVDTILKSFKKRPALPNDRGLENRALTRHEALSADFKKLFEELVAEGYFEPSFPQTFLRLLEAVALTVLAYGVFFQCETFISKFIAMTFVGFAISRFGWIQHEGGHNSLTGRPKADKFIQDLGMCLIEGGSSIWWNSQHNRHHAMPQRINRDVDLSTLPYVAFHTRTVKDPSEINNFFIKYQGYFYWTLDFIIVTLAWRFIIHPRIQFRKKAYFEILLGLPSLALAVYLGPMWYIAKLYWFAFFLGINFALSHSHLDVADKPTHWVEYSLTHTANIKPSLFVDFWMGYLNYQIEHHLFPTMPQFRQKQICHRVKALAEKHGLPYRVYSYPEACYLAVNNLHDVGHKLTSKDHF